MEESSCSNLRRSKRKIERKSFKKERVRKLHTPKNPLVALVLGEYKKLQQEGIVQHEKNIKQVWDRNRRQLDEDLRSHKIFLEKAATTKMIMSDEEPFSISGVGAEAGAATASAFVYGDSEVKEAVVKVGIKILGWMDKIPPVVAWTSIPWNVAEEDGKYLTNIPFLGDEIIDKDRKFIDDMINLYQGKLHGSGGTTSVKKRTRALDNETLDKLVKNTEASIKLGIGGRHEESVEPSTIFNAISEAILGSGTAKELALRYSSHSTDLDHPAAAPTYVKLQQHQQHPSSYSIPNIDGAHARDLPRRDTMHAFQYLFCRRCYQYDCTRGHNGDDHVDLENYKRARNPQNTMIQYECENPNCWRKQEKLEKIEDEEEEAADWSPSDKSMANSLIPSFQNPCYVAKLMLTKDCAQVERFMRRSASSLGMEQKPSSSADVGSSLCPAKIKKRSKKSSSVSKKNSSRRWINTVKRSEEGSGGLGEANPPLPPRFMPCQHAPHECDEKNPKCYCAKNGTSCEKFCSCSPSCKIRFPGCRCTSTCDSRRCVCFVAARECDPDLCTGCGAQEQDVAKMTCKNVNIQKRLHKHLLMGRSDVAGWGIFIKEEAQRGEFIAEYRGEIISFDESERRGHVYDKVQHTFLFELNDHFVVDATRKGNKARFVNSSKTPNCEVKRMLVNGDHRIGIYAKRLIEAGEELFYDYEDVLEKQKKVAAGDGIVVPSTKKY